jgi:uncharacterized protein
MLAERIGASQLAEMSAQEASLESELPPDDLPRLAQVLAHDPGGRGPALRARVQFRDGPESAPLVRIEVSGSLSLVCQRCLAPVGWPIAIDVTLAAVADDTEADGLASPFDSILLDQEGGLPLRAVVEDEILSALPLAPVHADPSECKGASPVPLGAGTAPERQAHRPFERLGRLMGTGGSGESNE